MYKYLLCWRYLRTRYIALASIISVMLGVATMIVVNSVMAGFADTMRNRLHGVLADVVVESIDFDGFRRPDEIMQLIKNVGGDRVVAMAPTVETPGMLTIVTNGGQTISRPVQIIGIDPASRTKTGSFADYLFAQKRRGEKEALKIPPSLAVPERLRLDTSPSGELLKEIDKDDPFREELERRAREDVPDHGTILGYALATHHMPGIEEDYYLAPEGSKAILTFPTAGRSPKAMQDSFTVVGYSKSGMSEYDSTHVYIPLARLQWLRGIGDGQGNGAVTHVQIKVREGVDLDALAMEIQNELERVRPMYFRVSSWEQKQGPLLAAVAVEQSILNMLLFFIIAVAGFGILATFSMIVVEKTRDIGVLKALGASSGGVRAIFLGYGLSLGFVGSGVGMVGGLTFVHNINRVEKWLSDVSGRKVFDDAIYYFKEIPTKVDPWTVAWIVGGTLLIAVGASVWPAHRASKLRPVQALRFE